MYGGNQDFESDQTIACPYDNSHRVLPIAMEDHLAKCRETFLATEKTVCPFNNEHVIFVPEIDYHKVVCPERPREDEEKQDASKCNEKDSSASQDAIEHENGPAKGNSSFQVDKDSATGCVSGQDVGGLGNNISVLGQKDETDREAFCGDQEMESKRARADSSVNEESIESDDTATGVKPLNHKTAIEKQLSQSDSDSTETDTSGTGESDSQIDRERFDYTKYKPSKEEREDFLKLIGQEKDGDMYQCRYIILNQPYTSTTWPAQSYTYVPNQYTAYQPAYVPFPNSYPMMAAIPAQNPYTTGYFPAAVPPPPHGFMHSTQGAYEYGYNSRPHHRYKRRNNFHHHSHTRYNYQNGCNTNDPQNHVETDSNSSSQSDAGLSDENMVTYQISNGANGNHATVKEPCAKLKNGRYSKKGPVTAQDKCHKKNTVQESNGVVKDFVDMGNVEERSVNGNLSDSSQEKETEEEKGEDEKKKSEREKQMRKLKKKINEILLLERKKKDGGTLDCDQLKKLSRKNDFEEELQYLSQSH